MLRQGGATLTLRLLARQQSASCMAAAAGGSSRAAAASEIAAEGAFAGTAAAPQVAQFSSAAAAAMARKQAHITGLGGLGSLLRQGASRTFASGAASAAPAGAAAAATGAAETAAAQQPSLLSRVVKAAAVLMGAVALATGTAAADSPEPWQWMFQDTANSTAQAMVDLHHDIMFFVITIAVAVLYLIGQIATKFHYSRQLKPEKLTHHTTLEVIWTVIPTFIVLSIAVPSLTLIYSLDQHADRPGLTVKVIGRQWYWSYEMHDHLQQKLLDPDRLVAIAEKSALKA